MSLLCERQMLNGIELNKENKFFWRGSDRPNFLPIVTQAVFCQEDIDRCHSASWQMLCLVVIDILNNGRYKVLDKIGATIILESFDIIMKDLVNYYNNEQTLFPDILPAIPQVIVSAYSVALDQSLNDLSQQFEAALKKNRLNGVIPYVYKYLSLLNSCVFNLRYPAVPAFRWNQSVGGAYDPRRWCYVDGDGNVISNEKTLDQSVPYKDYDIVFRKIDMRQEGYYLLSEFDGYLLHQLKNQSFTSLLEDTYLYFMHGLLDNHRVMASSSNKFRNKQNWESGGDVTIYYLYDKQWLYM